MQIARYEAVIRYISEYQCIYVKKYDNDNEMTMKIILLPCNTCGIHSYSMTLTGYIQQSVMEI